MISLNISHFSFHLVFNMKGLHSSTWKTNVTLKMLSVDLMELILAEKEGESKLSGPRRIALLIEEATQGGLQPMQNRPKPCS